MCLKIFLNCVRYSSKERFWFITTFTSPGYYGTSCDRRCPMMCPNMRCNKVFGFCECDPGRFGPKCNMPCPSLTWGPNCRHQCQCEARSTSRCHPEARNFKLRSVCRYSVGKSLISQYYGGAASVAYQYYTRAHNHDDDRNLYFPEWGVRV